MDATVVKYALWISGIVFVALIALFVYATYVSHQTPREKFGTSYTNDGSLWANTPECKHAKTGYVFRNELMLNNQNDSTNNSCIVNGAMLGLLADSNTCAVASDIPKVKWTNPLSLTNCQGNQACTDAVDLSNGMMVSDTTNWNSPSCVLTFNSNVSKAQLQAFEASLFTGVSGFLSANVVGELQEQISSLHGQIDAQSNLYYTNMSTLEGENSNLSSYGQQLYSSNLVLSTNSKNCDTNLKTANGSLATCYKDLNDANTNASVNLASCRKDLDAANGNNESITKHWNSDLSTDSNTIQGLRDQLSKFNKDGVPSASLWPGLRFWASYGGDVVTSVGYSTDMSDIGPATAGAVAVPNTHADFIGFVNHTDWNYMPLKVVWSGYLYTPVTGGKVTMTANQYGTVALNNSKNTTNSDKFVIKTSDANYPYYPVSVTYDKPWGGMLFTMTNSIPSHCEFMSDPNPDLLPTDPIRQVVMKTANLPKPTSTTYYHVIDEFNYTNQTGGWTHVIGEGVSSVSYEQANTNLMDAYLSNGRGDPRNFGNAGEGGDGTITTQQTTSSSDFIKIKDFSNGMLFVLANDKEVKANKAPAHW